MSGLIARYGFRFQDLFLLKKIIAHIGEIQRAKTDGTPPPAELRFGVEASVPTSEAKDWDVLVLRTHVKQVMEVKSGQITAEDRRAFWLRLREELFRAGEQHDQILPVMVIDSEKPPSAAEAWAALGTRMTFEENLRDIHPPLKPPGRVDRERKLIDEALFWICRATRSKIGDKDGIALTSKVDVEVAKAALVRFKLQKEAGSEIEKNVEDVLDLLVDGPDPLMLRRQMEGFINERATSKQMELHILSVNEFIREITLLERFLNRSPEVIRLVRLIKHELVPLCRGSWEFQFMNREEGLPFITLHEVQPELAALDWASRQESMVLLGDAGQGKSYSLSVIDWMIQEKYEMIEVFPLLAEGLMHSTDGYSETLSEAVHFICDMAALENRRTLFLIDGLDQLAIDKRHSLSSLLRTCAEHTSFLCVVTFRNVEWRDYESVRTHLQRWEKTLLKDWPKVTVSSIIKKTVQRDLSAGLMHLLQKPLYLDIFLRTFGSEEQVQVGLQTKDGLLKAYWERVVLTEEHLARWELIREACEQIVELNAWNPTVKVDHGALARLESIGLIVKINDRGTFSFRHPVLRDFAIAQWILSRIGDQVTLISPTIQMIRSTVTKYGAQRALIEILCENESDSDVSLKKYIMACSTQEQEEIARILGGLRPPIKFNLDLWERKPSPLFINKLIETAMYYRNRSWLEFLVKLNIDSIWVQRQDWIGENTLEIIVDYARIVSQPSQEGGDDDELLKEQAQLTLGWMKANKFSNVIAQARILWPFIIQYGLIDDVLQQINAVLEPIDIHFGVRQEILDALPHLVSRMSSENNLKGDALVPIFYKCIGLSFNGTTPVLNDDFENHVFTLDSSLIENRQDGQMPLLLSLPEQFVPVIINCLLAMVLQKKYSFSDYRNIQIEDGANNLLIDDDPTFNYWSQSMQYSPSVRLFNELDVQSESWFAKDPDWFISSICPTLLECPLASVQSILLRLYLDAPTGQRLIGEVKRIILKESMYHVWDNSYWLINSLIKVWDHLEEAEMDSIVQIIYRLSESPFIAGEYIMSLYVYHLRFTQKFNDLHIVFDGDMILRDPRADRIVDVERNFDDYREIFLQRELQSIGQWGSPEEQSFVEKLYLRTKDHTLNQEQISEYLDLILNVLPLFERDMEMVQSHPWVIRVISSIVTLYCESLVDNLQKNSEELHSKCKLLIRPLTEWALSLVQHSPLPRIPDNFAQKISHVSHDAWTLSLRLLNETLKIETPEDFHVLFDRLLVLIDDAFVEFHPLAQRTLFIEIRPYHWYKENNIGLNWIEERIRLRENISGLALIKILEGMIGRVEQADILRIVEVILSKEKFPPDALLLMKSLGELVGALSFYKHESGERSIFRKFADDLLRSIDSYPVLKFPEFQATFLYSLVFGMKKSVNDKLEDVSLSFDYGSWMGDVWEYLQALGNVEVEQANRFALYALSGIKPEKRTIDPGLRQEWWIRLFPTLLRVAQEGSNKEIALMFLTIRSDNSYIPTTGLLFLIESMVIRLNSQYKEINIHEGPMSWFQVITYTAEIIERISSKLSEVEKEVERCLSVLNVLAEAPISNRNAERVRIQMRNRKLD
ncbi:hypothetical protein QFZ77_007622 [Paenibacillus sp. V4I3]|uniref:hypothetical protein n=1 Tax=Paenibacillus sp. V4I3 TaxID=3042305 RepID=UPI00277ED2C5|nr:hypothetical protein [Paenibacillus sp. V4I3]MDQ0878963.1 hypothetical protein [Paenibacillus sp. V4I3]